MYSKKLIPVAALSLALLAGLAYVACHQTTTADEEYTRQPPDGETVVIKPQTPFVAKHAEVTVRLDIRKGELGKVEVEPQTAIIFADPRDERLVEQVLWRVECWMDGKLGSCPEDLVERVVIRPKEGCPPELFGFKELVIWLAEATGIASGEPNLEVYAEQMKRYQRTFRALMEKEQSLATSLLDCNYEPAGTAPRGIDLYNGLTWLYDVTVYRGERELFRLDPEIWVEKDADPG